MNEQFLLISLNFIMNHRALQVKCSSDEPVELLRDKLASKSSQLYIFWQNYNQLYHAYNEKCSQLQRLHKEIDTLRRQRTSNKATVAPAEQIFYKERYQYMERSVEQYKIELQRISNDVKQLKKQNQKYHEENGQLQIIIQELRNQNTIQKKHIEKILEQLKIAQNQINTMAKVYDQLGQKEMILSRYIAKEKQLYQQIEDQDAEIDELRNKIKQDKVEYERILKQSFLNYKNKVIGSLPGLVQTSKQRTPIITP